MEIISHDCCWSILVRTIMTSAATLDSTQMSTRKRFVHVLLFPYISFDLSCRSRSPSQDHSDGPPPTRRRSRSPQPRVRLDLPKVNDVDPVRRALRERELAARMAAVELEKAAKPKEQESAQDLAEKQAEFAKLVGSRSGGVYVPPARLRALQAAAASDKSSTEYQRLSWDALRKSITGIVNRVNIANIKQVVPELFSENLIRGRGLFGRSVMKAQASSLPFTPVFAALVAIINTKLPQVGELVLTRLISQFRRAFKRNDKVSRSSCRLSPNHLECFVRLSAIQPPPSSHTSSTKPSHMRSLRSKYLSCFLNAQPMTPSKLPSGSLVKLVLSSRKTRLKQTQPSLNVSAQSSTKDPSVTACST